MSQVVLTKLEFAKAAAYLSAGTGRTLTREQADVYFDTLNDIPAPVLMACCRRAIQEQKESWLPTPGLIRSFASEAISGLLPATAEEWKNVLKAVRRFGYMRQAEGMAALSAIARQAIEGIGGWQVICDCETPTILGAQFRGAYEAAAKREADMRRISPELRPVITAGQQVTPRTMPGNPAQRVIELVANRFSVPAEGGCQ